MSLVLEYAQPAPPPRWSAIPASVGIALLTSAHLHLCWQISRFMLVPVCQRLGQNFTAWTPIAWLPGCVVGLNAGTGVGVVFMFLNSLLAGALLQEMLCRYLDGQQMAWRKIARDWRTFLTVLLWCGWVPVPSVLCFIYQFGVWANRS